MKNSLFWKLVGVIVLIWTVTVVLVSSSVAISALRDLGFTSVTVVEKKWFLVSLHGCGRSDWILFRTEAARGNETPVPLNVCWDPFWGTSIKKP